jgi:hypothetical protein
MFVLYQNIFILSITVCTYFIMLGHILVDSKNGSDSGV